MDTIVFCWRFDSQIILDVYDLFSSRLVQQYWGINIVTLVPMVYPWKILVYQPVLKPKKQKQQILNQAHNS